MWFSCVQVCRLSLYESEKSSQASYIVNQLTWKCSASFKHRIMITTDHNRLVSLIPSSWAFPGTFCIRSESKLHTYDSSRQERICVESSMIFYLRQHGKWSICTFFHVLQPFLCSGVKILEKTTAQINYLPNIPKFTSTPKSMVKWEYVNLWLDWNNETFWEGFNSRTFVYASFQINGLSIELSTYFYYGSSTHAAAAAAVTFKISMCDRILW